MRTCRPPSPAEGRLAGGCSPEQDRARKAGRSEASISRTSSQNDGLTPGTRGPQPGRLLPASGNRLAPARCRRKLWGPLDLDPGPFHLKTATGKREAHPRRPVIVRHLPGAVSDYRLRDVRLPACSGQPLKADAACGPRMPARRPGKASRRRGGGRLASAEAGEGLPGQGGQERPEPRCAFAGLGAEAAAGGTAQGCNGCRAPSGHLG